ncbi:MAG TPA: hypothetical protein PKL31_07155 [Fulvivirga sp.]|nr:hypothetical protein [Fulvivirga sp.]
MKEVTLKIPDNKYQFFMELVRNLGFEKIEDFDIPEEHKVIVKERIKNSKVEELIPWQEARKQLHFKEKS